MQTFLPYPDFHESVSMLDDKRLGKQRVEGYQILRTLSGYTQGWRNHPAVVMWRGHEAALLRYTRLAVFEWKNRGFNDTLLDKLDAMPLDYYGAPPPSWLGERLCSTHRANLYIKNPAHYPARWEWDIYELESTVCCYPKCNYYWPSHATPGGRNED